MSDVNEFGEDNLRRRLKILQAITPEQRQQMEDAGLAPQQMANLDQRRSAEEAMLQRQIGDANAMALQPVEARGNSTPAAAANLTANILRMFGGMALSQMRSKDLSAAMQDRERQGNEFLGKIRTGRNAARDAEINGLISATSQPATSLAAQPVGEPDVGPLYKAKALKEFGWGGWPNE